MNPASAVPVATVIQARSGRWLERALLGVFIVHGLPKKYWSAADASQ